MYSGLQKNPRHPAGDLSEIAQLPWVDDALPSPLAWERHAGCDDGIRELLGGDVHNAPVCVQDVRVALVIRLAGGVQGHELEEEVQDRTRTRYEWR